MHTYERVPPAHLAVEGVLEADGDPIEKASLSLLEFLQCLQLFLTLVQKIRQAVYLLVHRQCLSNSEGVGIRGSG